MYRRTGSFYRRIKTPYLHTINEKGSNDKEERAGGEGAKRGDDL